MGGGGGVGVAVELRRSTKVGFLGGNGETYTKCVKSPSNDFIALNKLF